MLLSSLLATATHRILYKLLVAIESGGMGLLVVSGTSTCVLIGVPFLGWLADAKLGNYRVVRIGIVVSLLASVLVSLFSLLYYNTPLGNNQVVVKMLLAVTSLFHWMGTVVVLPSSFQLSLEQMPDASAENITSLISWFTLFTSTGFWLGDVVQDLFIACIHLNHSDSDLQQILTLVPVVFASINFILFFLLSSKWLIIEPKSPQSLMNIYRVLKFAAKHKAPLNRSSLTYWEEDIPSRIDLSKSRYGGPFTTEQVEDVKVFFRILAVSIGIFLMMVALGVHEYDYYSVEVFNTTNFDACETNGLFLFTLNPAWCAMVILLVHEFFVYPCFCYKHRLPSSMKRIGIVSFAVLLRSIMYLTVSILMYFNIVERRATWMMSINSILYGVLLVAMFRPSLEFICAQAPYNMRSLLTCYIQFIFWLAFISGDMFGFEFHKYCQAPGCSLANASVGAALSIFAFVLYLIIAHWYKRRVRDDIGTPHKWVEEVYDRYLTAAANN